MTTRNPATTLTHQQVRARGWSAAQIKNHLAEHRVPVDAGGRETSPFAYPAALVLSAENTDPALSLENRVRPALRFAEHLESRGPGVCCTCTPLAWETQFCNCHWCGGESASHRGLNPNGFEQSDFDVAAARGGLDFPLFEHDGALRRMGVEKVAASLPVGLSRLRYVTTAALQRQDVVMGLGAAPADYCHAA